MSQAICDWLYGVKQPAVAFQPWLSAVYKLKNCFEEI